MLRLKTGHADRLASRWLEARDQWLDQVFEGLPVGSRFAGKMDFQAVFMMGASWCWEIHCERAEIPQAHGFSRHRL